MIKPQLLDAYWIRTHTKFAMADLIDEKLYKPRFNHKIHVSDVIFNLQNYRAGRGSKVNFNDESTLRTLYLQISRMGFYVNTSNEIHRKWWL